MSFYLILDNKNFYKFYQKFFIRKEYKNGKSSFI